jgi:hypothetical protein
LHWYSSQGYGQATSRHCERGSLTSRVGFSEEIRISSWNGESTVLLDAIDLRSLIDRKTTYGLAAQISE